MKLVTLSACAIVLAASPQQRLPALEEGRFAIDGAGAAANGQEVRMPPPQRSLRLAIVPDRTTGRAWGLPYLRSAVRDLARIRPDAIFTVGDMVQGYTRDEAQWDREADEYIDIVRPLGPSLFPTAGNHDVISGSRDPADTRFADRYRHRFGPLWYAVEFDLATVLVLFSDDGGADGAIRISNEQLAWLDQALSKAEARGRPIVLLMHRPLWRYESAQWESRVAPLLRRSEADVVIAGHFHSLQRDRDVDGVEYHIVGTCGGMIDQHPLAGQLQHLTFLEIGDDGATRLWHQPVGMTLPDDFILRDDQDRVWSLTNAKGVLRWHGTLPNPDTGGSGGTLRLTVQNPTDVPIAVRADLVRGEPIPAEVGEEPWVSRTLIDARNPFVTDGETPFRMETPEPVTIEPGREATIPVAVRFDPARHRARVCPLSSVEVAVRAPEVRVTASFVDGHGRTVPVWLRTTLPLDRTLEIGGPAVPIQALVPSPYDVLEPDPTVRVVPADDGAATLELVLDDPIRPDDQTLAPPGRQRFANPLHDAIRLQLATGEEFFLEPFRANPQAFAVRGDALEPTALLTPSVELSDQRAVVRLTLNPELVRTATAEAGGINLGVADNDFTYHTQWRWLMPAGQWAPIRPRPSGSASPSPRDAPASSPSGR